MPQDPRRSGGGTPGEIVIELLHIRALSGPNLWADVPILEIRSRFAPDTTAALAAQLAQRLEQDLAEELPRSSRERIAQADSPARAFGMFLIELQVAAGGPVEFLSVQPADEPTVAVVAVEIPHETSGRECLRVAHNYCNAVLSSQPFDLRAELPRLRDVVYLNRLGPSTEAIVTAAKTRGIPMRRLDNDCLVQLGQGVKQRRILIGETDCTSAVAESIAKDKELTRSMLKAVGVPVPKGRAVESAEEAWKVIQSFRGPAVIKPRDANHGRGVATHLTTEEQVTAAFAVALRESRAGVMVEQYIEGHDYRLLVVNGRMVAAARREPAQVVGDGQHSIAELVEIINRDPLRGDGYMTPLKKIEIDDVALDVLASQGYQPASVPSAGTRVFIRRNINYYNGGFAVDVTPLVHPDTALQAAHAAQVVGLDVAGIDLRATDISQPLLDQKGAVLEVNAGPGMQMHLPPSQPPRPVGEAVVEYLFPNGDNGRVPLIAIAEPTDANSALAQAITERLGQLGFTVALSCRDGQFVGQRPIRRFKPAPPMTASRDLLRNPLVDAAVVEVLSQEVLDSGFGFEWCEALIVPDAESAADPRVLQRLLQLLTSNGALFVPTGSRVAAQISARPRQRIVPVETAAPGALAAAVAAWMTDRFRPSAAR